MAHLCAGDACSDALLEIREGYGHTCCTCKAAQTLLAGYWCMYTWHTCLQGVLKLMHWLVTSWHLWRGVAGRGRPISPPDKARYEGPRLLAMLFGLDCQRCRPCCCQAVLLWCFLAPVQHSTCQLDLTREAWAACHALWTGLSALQALLLSGGIALVLSGACTAFSVSAWVGM